jgi:hypothetical protein
MHDAGKAGYPSTSDIKYMAGGFVPAMLRYVLPEGVFATGTIIDNLGRGLFDPAHRGITPPGTTTFYHYMTEHGSDPAEAGITDPAQSKAFKAKAAVRALTYWLNKGITKIDLYSAWSPKDVGYGLLDASIDYRKYNGLPTAQAMSPALQAISNLTTAMAGAAPLTAPRSLGAGVTAVGQQYQVFPGEGNNPALWYRELFTVLPFQVTDHRFVVAAYVMSNDASVSLPPMGFQLTLTGVNGSTAVVTMTDPLTGQVAPAHVIGRTATSVTVSMWALDYPRLITIND